MDRLNELLSVLAVLVFVAGAASCESSPSPGASGDSQTIAIVCTDGGGNLIVDNGVQMVEVDVGETIRCAIHVRDLPIETEDGLRARPAQYEWAFSSTDGGSLHPNDSKGIVWDVDTHYRSFTTLDPECAAAVRDGNAEARALDACATVCCEIGPADFELLEQAECQARTGTRTELWRCPSKSPLQPVCCELPIEYPNGTAEPSFVDGYRQITTRNTCETYCECTAACTTAPVVQCGEPLIAYGPSGPNPADFISRCTCCRLPDDSLRSTNGRCIEDLGGEIVGWEECWEYPEACGRDDECDQRFCEAADESVDIRREDVCVADGGEVLGNSHDGSMLVCCQRTDTKELFPISILGSTRWVSAETEDWFEAVAEGTVTIRMRQLIAPPILFNEAHPGSSLLQIRVGPLSACQPDFDISGTFTERYNCSDGVNCVDPDVETIIDIVAGSETGEFLFSSGNWSGAGTLCNNHFEWTATSPLFSEEGIWIFSDPNTFTKTSDYTYFSGGGGGTCTGSASSVASPPPPAPIGPCP